MKKKWIIMVSIIAIVLLGGVLAGPIMSNVEHPEYQVISSDENIEIRQYNQMIIAEVDVHGERREAIREGFRMLAGYIFGNNTVQQEIAMTAPVQQQTSEKIAMTAPVQQQASDDAWKISFVMPSEHSMDDLPEPDNQRVMLKKIPQQKFIVIKFSGISSSKNIDRHEKQLRQHISEHRIETVAAPKYAFYNPPWTLPFMRRNEIMIEINGRN